MVSANFQTEFQAAEYIYRNLPIKRPWALEIHGPKNGGGRLHGEAICTYNAYTHGPQDHQNNGCGRLHGDGRLLGRIRYMCTSIGCIFINLPASTQGYIERGLFRFTYGASDALVEFLHVDNFVQAHIRAAEAMQCPGSPVVGKTYLHRVCAFITV